MKEYKKKKNDAGVEREKFYRLIKKKTFQICRVCTHNYSYKTSDQQKKCALFPRNLPNPDKHFQKGWSILQDTWTFQDFLQKSVGFTGLLHPAKRNNL